MNCIFCEIVAKKEPAEVLFENDDVIAILDQRPLNFGHALVIPKMHCPGFLDVPEDVMNEINKAAKVIANSIMVNLEADGFNLIVNNGIAAGQTVFHYHLHIIPRYNEDAINAKFVFKNYLPEQKKEIADRIRNYQNNKEMQNG